MLPGINAAKSCVDGGVCKVGDVGPGGGRVFRVDPIGEPFVDPATRRVALAHYWEVAPRTSDSIASDVVRLNCNQPYAPASSLLFGTPEIADRIAKCRDGALALKGWGPPRGAQGLSLPDWYLPRATDMLILSASGLFEPIDVLEAGSDRFGWLRYGLTGRPAVQRFWTSDLASDCQFSQCPVVYFPEIRQQMALPCSLIVRSGSPDCGTAVIRPVRAFGFTDRYPCAYGGACAVGDVGPNGGLVFVNKFSGGLPVKRTNDRVPFTEILVRPDVAKLIPTTWCDSAPGNYRSDGMFGEGVMAALYLVNAGLPTGLPCGVMNTRLNESRIGINAGRLDGSSTAYVPSKNELGAICSTAKTTKVTPGFFASRENGDTFRYCGLSSAVVASGLRGLWTSTPAGSTTAWAWSFERQELVAVSITDRSYGVVAVQEGAPTRVDLPRWSGARN